MAIRVLVVDDSGFFRRRIIAMLNSDSRLEVVGEASNGLEAVVQAERIRPDVITMDVEMPVMDGITAVRRIMAARPTPILMFSILTTEGARATLEALEAGAVDFVPKSFAGITQDADTVARMLCSRVVAVASGASPARTRSVSTPVAGEGEREAGVAAPPPRRRRSGRRYEVVAIAASTGGPTALPRVLGKLPSTLPVPLLIVQHMPANFTPAFARRLDQQCAIHVKEAEDGDPLRPGTALLAPGGKQMTVRCRGGRAVVCIHEGDPELNYKPSADVTFGSLADQCSGAVLSLVLTGMGADGREGVRLLKQKGATVWAQDRESSVIYGMPGAVAKANLTDEILDLDSIGSNLAQLFH